MVIINNKYEQNVNTVIICFTQNRLHLCRDLARNEEFSGIAVINIFFTALKKKTVICGGGAAGKMLT